MLRSVSRGPHVNSLTRLALGLLEARNRLEQLYGVRCRVLVYVG